MGAKLAAMACKRYFKFRRIVPMHYATFPLLDPTPDKFIAEMGADAGKVTGAGEGEGGDALTVGRG